MNRILSALCLFAVSVTAFADDSTHRNATLLFEDKFERSESDDAKEELGQGWGTNSAKRAGGNKQVDLRDGTMHIEMHPTADHAVSVTHPAEFRDGQVRLRFMLPRDQDSLGLNFADLKYKKVHAGHLFVAKIATKSVQLSDLKMGRMDLKTRQMRLADQLTEEAKERIKRNEKRFPHQLKPGTWHDLVVTVKGDTLAVQIDGDEVAKFASEGIAHPTKRTLRLAVPKRAVVDDVQIFSLSSKEAK